MGHLCRFRWKWENASKEMDQMDRRMEADIAKQRKQRTRRGAWYSLLSTDPGPRHWAVSGREGV